MKQKEKISKIAAYLIRGLPLAGIVYGSFQPIRANIQPWLILATLIWLQVFVLSEVFSINK